MTATYWPKNTATLSGVSEGSTDTTTAVAWQRIGTDAGIDTEHAYVINKVDSSNYAKGLEGAVFTVYKADGDCDDSNDEVVGEYVSDENGHISISKTLMEAGKCYQVYVPFLGWITVGWTDPKKILKIIKPIISKKPLRHLVMNYLRIQKSIISTILQMNVMLMMIIIKGIWNC